MHLDTRLGMLKKCVELAGIKGVNYEHLWKGCLSNEERMAKIIAVLNSYGLKGEPTLAKCREIGQQNERLAEVKELDPSAIINPSERTTRSGNTAESPSLSTIDPIMVEDMYVELELDTRPESDSEN